MFSYLTQLLYRFQSKPVRMLALSALAVLVFGVLLWGLLRWLRRRRQDSPEGWAALLHLTLGSVLKVLVGLAVLAGLCLHLSFQAHEFARLRGGKSQRNYAAVTTIWGRPHLQREMNVRLSYTTTHFYDKDGLELDPEKLHATTQPVGYRKRTVEHTVAGNPIVSGDHHFDLVTNYRRKGGAWYPGFETDANFSYVVENFAGRVVDAAFRFPLPNDQGVVDGIEVLIDGRPVRQKLLIDREAIRWRMPLEIDARHAVAVRYHSRGLNHFRFEPGAGQELAGYRISMTCVGIPRDRINYPVGCMTPTEPIVERTVRRDGQAVPATYLAWNLDRAVTRLGMGVIVPDKTQPGYYVARVLGAAPWGLVLLGAMVLVTYLARGREPHWLTLAVLAVGYHLYYLLTAHLADYWPGLVGGMVISGAAVVALLAAYNLLRATKFCALATLALLAVFCFVYPALRISDHEGLLVTVLYVVLLAYAIALLILPRLRGTPQRPDSNEIRDDTQPR